MGKQPPRMKNLPLISLVSFIVTIQQGFSQHNPYAVSATGSPSSQQSQDNRSAFVKQFPFLKMVDWFPGMRFMVEPAGDNPVTSHSQIPLSPLHSLNSYTRQILQKDFEWKIFTFRRLEQRDVGCPKGTCQRTYLIFECDSSLFEFEFAGDTTELRQATVFNQIDHLVYLDEVDKCKELLLGKTIYVLTGIWLREFEPGRSGYDYNQPKYVPVRVTKVGLGNPDAPVRIVFKADGVEEAFLDTRLSGVNQGSAALGINFDDAFSTIDPRLMYPKISKATWKLISSGDVKIGMTGQECLLSWGQPTDVNETTVRKGTYEQWVYGESTYLYFMNGRLTSIQH
jgi:hypothetical protein